MQQRYPRETLEGWIDHLVRKYPACFCRDPTLKRPLKKSIENDLRDESAIDAEAALSYYTRNWDYQNSLQAGADRIDLDGKKVGTVTESEFTDSSDGVSLFGEEKQRVREKRAGVATDQLRKIDAPPREPEAKPLARLESIMARTVGLMAADEDKALQSALAIASLKILIQEAEKVIAALDAYQPNKGV
jgi:sRNA-binding protein